MVRKSKHYKKSELETVDSGPKDNPENPKKKWTKDKKKDRKEFDVELTDIENIDDRHPDSKIMNRRDADIPVVDPEKSDMDLLLNEGIEKENYKKDKASKNKKERDKSQKYSGRLQHEPGPSTSQADHSYKHKDQGKIPAVEGIELDQLKTGLASEEEISQLHKQLTEKYPRKDAGENIAFKTELIRKEESSEILLLRNSNEMVDLGEKDSASIKFTDLDDEKSEYITKENEESEYMAKESYMIEDSESINVKAKDDLSTIQPIMKKDFQSGDVSIKRLTSNPEGAKSTDEGNVEKDDSEECICPDLVEAAGDANIDSTSKMIKSKTLSSNSPDRDDGKSINKSEKKINLFFQKRRKAVKEKELDEYGKTCCKDSEYELRKFEPSVIVPKLKKQHKRFTMNKHVIRIFKLIGAYLLHFGKEAKKFPMNFILPGQKIEDERFYVKMVMLRACLNILATFTMIQQFIFIFYLGFYWLRLILSWTVLLAAWYFKQTLIIDLTHSNDPKDIKTIEKLRAREEKRRRQDEELKRFEMTANDSDDDEGFEPKTIKESHHSHKCVRKKRKRIEPTYEIIALKNIYHKLKGKLYPSYAAIHTTVFILFLTQTYAYCDSPNFIYKLTSEHFSIFIFYGLFAVALILDTLTACFPIKLIYIAIPFIVLLIKIAVCKFIVSILGGMTEPYDTFIKLFDPNEYGTEDRHEIIAMVTISIFLWIISIPRYYFALLVSYISAKRKALYPPPPPVDLHPMQEMKKGKPYNYDPYDYIRYYRPRSNLEDTFKDY